MEVRIRGLVRPVGAFLVLSTWSALAILRVVWALLANDFAEAASAFGEYVAPTGIVVMYWFEKRSQEKLNDKK